MNRPGPVPGEPHYDSASFRDPSSRVWRSDSRIYRGLDVDAASNFEALSTTGFYEQARASGQLVATTRHDAAVDSGWEAVLEHEPIPVISYPHEWSFSMLQDAALLTLRLQRRAIDDDITMKDASPYNVQFVGASPRFIDIGSFERYRAGEPWWGYRQFCQLFLYPLMFTAYKDLPHQPWLRGSIDGVTPEHARRVLEGRRKGHKGFFAHVWLHAKADRRLTGSSNETIEQMKRSGYNRNLLIATLDRLIKLVGNLEWERSESRWAQYSGRGHYEPTEVTAKQDFVRSALAGRRYGQVWDIGANDGMFSRIASDHADTVLALDADALVVDRLYRELHQDGPANVVPLVMDFADPSPGIGWAGRERPPLGDRSRPDAVLALAVIHHLALTHNVPTEEFLDLLATMQAAVVLEVPTEHDPMVKALFAHKRPGTHRSYNLSTIESEIQARFEVRARRELAGSTRVLFHLTSR